MKQFFAGAILSFLLSGYIVAADVPGSIAATNSPQLNFP